MKVVLCLISLLAAVTLGTCRLNTTQFHTWETIDHYMHVLELEHPFLVTVARGGFTSEGRPIRYVKISSTGFQDQLKPIIYIDALAHANEWITAPVVTYIMDQLVSNPEHELVKRADWILLPVVNPDGYVYSYTWDRFWLKTRSESNHSRCLGVDVIRNVDYHFYNRLDHTNSHCSDSFPGETPFSEPEARVIRDIMLQYKLRICLYLSLQAWGSKIIFPFDEIRLPMRRIVTLKALALDMAKAIKSAKAEPNSPEYIVGSSIGLQNENSNYYVTSYAISIGIPMAYQIVLPGPGKFVGDRHGLLVHSSKIDGIVKETWAGIQAGAFYAIRIFKTRKDP